MHNIKPMVDNADFSKGDGSTRGQRARANAVARLKARHVERDYLGRPVLSEAEKRAAMGPLSVSAAKGGVRLDAWLVDKGFASSRERAKELVASGAVAIEGLTKVKGSTVVVDESRVTVYLPNEGACAGD